MEKYNKLADPLFYLRRRIVDALAAMAPHGGFVTSSNGPYRALFVYQFRNVHPMSLLLWSGLDGGRLMGEYIEGSCDATWIDLADWMATRQ